LQNTLIHSEKRNITAFLPPILKELTIVPVPAPGCTGMQGQMQKKREDFHLLPSVQHDFHRSDFHETLIVARRRFLLKKNFCTDFHDKRTIQSLSLRQRWTDERTRFTQGVHFLLRKQRTLSVMSGCALSATNSGQLLPSPQKQADWYMCTDVSAKRYRRLVWHMSSARSVEAVSLKLG